MKIWNCTGGLRGMYNLDLIRGVRPLRVSHRFSNKYFFQKNVYSEHLWLCDNENSYIFEMSYDDIWQGSVKSFSNIRKIIINV